MSDPKKTVRFRKGAKATPGHIIARVPKAAKKLAMPQATRPSALTDPVGGSIYPATFGRLPYRDANPNLWSLSSGNFLYSPSLTSANREILPHRDKAVANAREADRNQPLISAGIDFRAINTVGANLRLQYLPNWEAMGIDADSDVAIEFIQNVENEFSLWAEDHRLLCDAQRQGQFGALMLLSCRECFGTEGETLIIVRYDEERMDKYSARYATFVEVVSCDRLSNPDTYTATPDGPLIVGGKELDEYGAAVAFHVERSHRDENRTGERKWDRVVRETDFGRPVGVHFFFRSRAGMQRNMPAIIRSLRNVKMLDRFDDATLQRAVIRAILSIFVESEATSEEMLTKLSTQTPGGGSNPLADLWDKRFGLYEEMALAADGVRIPVLPPGDKITMASSGDDAPDNSDFRSAFLRSMARELHLTYEQFSGDYSETTFSSARAAVIDSWRLVTVDRILFTQHTVLQCFSAWLEELWVRGDEIGFDWPAALPDFYENQTAYCQAEFRGPGMGWVDPEKDVNAAGKRVEQAFTSPTGEAANQGQDFRDNIDQIARDRAYAKRKGIFLPGTPEFVAMNNPVPPPQDPAGGDGANDKGDESQPARDSGEAAARELAGQEDRP